MNLRRIISGFVAATLLVSTGSDVQAQSRRSSSIASLGQMGCQSLKGLGGYQAANMDIPIGMQIFRAIAYLGRRQGFLIDKHGIMPEEATTVACRLAEPREIPKFRTLTLSFGFADNSKEIDDISINGSVTVRLSVYKDGNFYESIDVNMGDKNRWPIDITNTRTIALKAECIRLVRDNYYAGCPILYFFEDTLER